LVYEKQIAQDVNAYNPSREIAGIFNIISTALPGKTLEEIEQEINAEIERIKKQPPTAEEVARTYNRYAAQAILGLQTVLGKADQLNNNATFFGKPDLFQQQLNEYRMVTPADVSRVANKYLTADYLVINFVPRKEKIAATQNTAPSKNVLTQTGGDMVQGESQLA
jgi:zinc protease